MDHEMNGIEYPIWIYVIETEVEVKIEVKLSNKNSQPQQSPNNSITAANSIWKKLI